MCAIILMKSSQRFGLSYSSVESRVKNKILGRQNIFLVVFTLPLGFGLGVSEFWEKVSSVGLPYYGRGVSMTCTGVAR